MTRRRDRKPETAAAPAQEKRALPLLVLFTALVAFIVLALGNIIATSPTSDETVHLAGGYSYLVTGDYRINPEHPPLLKKLAALPLLMMHVWPPRLTAEEDGSLSFSVLRESWAMGFSHPLSHWLFAHHLLYGVRDAALQRSGAGPLTMPTTVRLDRRDFLNDPSAMFLRARIVMLLLGVLLAVLIFIWSRELWGWWGGALSALLFCFDPNFIAHSGLVTTDAGTALFMAAAIWFFWRATRRFTPIDAAGFALTFGLAQVAKYSALLLVPMLIVLAVHRRTEWRRVCVLLVLAAVVSIATIWMSYGLRFTASPDPEAAVVEEAAIRARGVQDAQIDARDRVPTGHPALRSTIEEWAARKSLATVYPDGAPPAAVRRAMRTTRAPLVGRLLLFAHENHLLPEAYLAGFASVELGSLERETFLRGEYTTHGFPSYFFWTFVYKTPIPIIAAIIAGCILAVRSRSDAVAFLAWPVIIYLAVAVPSTLNIGHRHILAIYPFLYVAAGSLALVWRRWPATRRIAAAAIVAICLTLPVLVVFSTPLAPMWGRHLAYMNELAGGPPGGYTRLVDSNLDWGQDLPALAEWIARNKVEEPVGLVYFGTADPQFFGIRYVNLPLGYFARPELGIDAVPIPGYLAISANHYNGFRFAPQSRDYWRRFLESKNARRVGTAGYSIFIYRIE